MGVTNIARGIFDKVEVVQLDLDGKYINEFRSISHASRVLNITEACVSHVVLGKALSANDFIFVNKEHYDPKKNYSYKWLQAKRKFLSSATKQGNNKNKKVHKVRQRVG